MSRIGTIVMGIAALGVVTAAQVAAPAADAGPAPGSQAASAPAGATVTMTQNSGYTTADKARVKKFVATADGEFVWTVTTRANNPMTVERAAGRLTKDALAGLIAKLSAAGKGEAAEDAGYVTFEFRDADGKLQTREYSMPNAPPCAGLLSEVARLVKDNAVKDAASKPATSAPAAPKVD
jgi:hypothetical protein